MLHESIDDDGVITKFRQNGHKFEIVDDPLIFVERKFALLRSARSILSQFKSDDGYTRYRTSHCNHTPSTGSTHRVDVYLSTHGDKKFASFGTQQCGSVWLCPVCASRISSVRAQKIESSIEQHKAAGGHIAFLTLTIPHRAGNRLASELVTFDEAMKKFSSGRRAVEYQEKINYFGSIRALEITHGANGWHVHIHMLLFLNSFMDSDELKRITHDHWLKCTPKDRRPSFFRGVDVVAADAFVSTYLSKWGVSDELTKGHTKTGRKKTSRTPFELLADAADGHAEARALFSEYASCFVIAGKKRASSRKQIFTSSKLKCYSDDKTEDDEAKAIIDSAKGLVIGSIPLEHFKKLRDEGMLVSAMQVVKSSGMDGLIQMLNH